MPLSPAASDDTWYRWVLKKNEPQAEKSGLYKYFEKYFEPPQEARPWSRELSGRLESIAPDWREDGAQKAASQNIGRKKPDYENRGRWHAEVERIRALTFDVFHEPTDDPAHANLVRIDDGMFDETGKIVPFVVDDLIQCLQWEAA